MDNIQRCIVNKIAVFYGHVASNLGDLAINAGELIALKQAYPDAEVTFVALHVSEGAAYNNAQAETASVGESSWTIYRTSFHHALNYLSQPAKFFADCGVNDCDLVVLASGEHLFAYEDNPNTRALYWRTLPALAAKAAGKRCLLLPSTFGPFETEASKKWISALLKTVDGYAVRETGSEQLLIKEFDCHPQLLPDPAFFIKPPRLRDQSQTEISVLGLAMRAEDWGIRLAKELRNAAHEADEIREPGELAFEFSLSAALDFFSRKPDGQLRVFVQTVADKQLAERLVERLKELEWQAQVQVIMPESIPDYLNALADVDALVASRFHALIMGLIAHVPVYGVYFPVHGHKIPGLFSWLGLSTSCAVIGSDASAAASSGVQRLFSEPFNWSAVDAVVLQGRQALCEWIKSSPSSDVVGDELFEAALALNELAKDLISLGYEQEKNALKVKLTSKLESDFELRLQDWQREVDSKQLRERDELQSNYHERLNSELDILRVRHELSLQEQRLALQAEADQKQLDEREKLLNEYSVQLDAERNSLKAYYDGKLEEKLAEQQSQFDSSRQQILDDLGAKYQARIEAVKREQSLRVESFKQKHDALKKSGAAQVKKLQVELEQLGSEKLRLNNEAVKLRGKLNTIQNSTSYQIAVEAARSLRSRRKLLSLPIRLYAIYSESRSIRQGAPRLAVDLDNGKNLEASLAEIELNSASTMDAAAELMKESKVLSEQERYSEALDVACRALELHRSEATIRAVFWAQQNAGHVEDAFNTVCQLQQFLGDKPSLMQKERLDFIRSQPSFQLNLKSMLPEKELSTAYEPIKGRLAYVLHNSLPFSSGGYATRAQGLARGLVAQGYEVFAFTRPGYPLDINKNLDAESVPEVQDVDGITYVRTLEPSRKNLRMQDFMPIATDVMVAHFKHYKPEVIVAASNYICALPALFAARKLGLPFVYEVRGFWEITRLSREPGFINHASYKIQELMEAFVCKQADKVLTLTEAMKVELIRRGVDGNKIDIIPNACQPELFEPSSRDEELAEHLGIPGNVPVIGYVGTFVDYEGLDDLARACGILKKRGLEFRLLMVGNENVSGTERGPIAQAVIAAAEEFGFIDWLIMPGRVPHEKVASYYSLIDIAPFPRKPWPVCEMVSPMKPLEAMAMEKAVVVSSVSALAEMAGYGDYGVIFDKGSEHALADALADVIADPVLRHKLGQVGRQHVLAERTWMRSAQRFSDALPTISVGANEAIES